jgi:hypothetical protein
MGAKLTEKGQGMTHDELLAKIDKPQIHTIHYTGLASEIEILTLMASRNALRSVVELHKPTSYKVDKVKGTFCLHCDFDYPCPTIQAIEKELA